MEYKDHSPEYGGGRAEPAFGVRRCRRCDGTAVVLGPDGADPTCHGEPMRHERTPDRPVSRGALGAVLADAVGVPRSGVNVCYALLVEGLLSVGDIAACVDRDGATIRTHLQRLVAADLLGRASLPREDGGAVAVYHLADTGRRPETLAEFCVWAARAAGEPVPDAADPFGDAAAAFCEAF